MKNSDESEKLEQFLKGVQRLSDKDCCKNKQLEHLVRPSKTKNALTLPEQALLELCARKAKAKRAARRRRGRDKKNSTIHSSSSCFVAALTLRGQRKSPHIHHKQQPQACPNTTACSDQKPVWIEHFPKSAKRFSDKKCGGNKNLEQFLKSGDRFSDKNCGKNKELEHLVEPSEGKDVLGQYFVPKRAELYAALDLGTNNCRLLIATPTSPGRFRALARFSRIVRLGEGVADQDILSDAAMERAMEALDICRFKLSQWPVKHQRLIATEACRQAVNGAAFLERVRAQLGLDLEIVSRETEARLAVAGCSTLIEPETQALVLFDIGGGSSEIALVDMSRRRSCRLAEHIIAWTSLPVGVVTLAERFGGSHVSTHDFNRMKTYVESLIDQFDERDKLGELVKSPSFHLLGTSGTMTTLAGVHLELERYDRRRIDGVWMCGEDVTRMTQRLLSWNMEQRMANPCIGPDRADLVLAGCAILEAIRSHWPSQRLRVADRGLREGILMELMTHQQAWSAYTS